MDNNVSLENTNQSFTDDRIENLFKGQDKGLVRLFIDTLSFAQQRITVMLKQADIAVAKVKIMIELDKIYQSSKYLAINDIADLIAAMKERIPPEADDTALLQNILHDDLKILQKIIDYWYQPVESTMAKRINEERKILLNFSKEDEDLQELYLQLLKEYLTAVYEILISVKKENITSEKLQTLKEIMMRLDISTGFMNYTEPAELIREGLIALEEYKSDDAVRWKESFIKIYNILIDNIRVQFSGSKGMQESCKKI